MTRAGFDSAFSSFISNNRESARGMTDTGVGSGALLGSIVRMHSSASSKDERDLNRSPPATEIRGVPGGLVCATRIEGSNTHHPLRSSELSNASTAWTPLTPRARLRVL